MADGRAQATRAAATERMLGLLADGRARTLGALFAEAGARFDPGVARALASKASVFARSVAGLGLAELEQVHVASREAARPALASDEVLVGILGRLASGRVRAHPVASLIAAVATRDRAGFRAALAARVKDQRWPEGVGTLVAARGTVLVFRLEDVVQGRVAAGFARAFDDAFERLRRERGLNLVALSALRAALGAWPREAFDRELHELRRANQVVLHTSDGRHGRPGPEEVAAAIDEGGRRFVYAARREAHD